jgi:hypothetical protein
MASAILLTITILYLGNFFLFANECLKEEIPPVVQIRVDWGRVLQILQSEPYSRKQQSEKVNWKKEGF